MTPAERRERNRVRAAARRASDPERSRAKRERAKARRRERLALIGAAPLTRRQKRAIAERDGAQCYLCGQTAAVIHIDHVVPVQRGGTNDPSNLAVACSSCNLRKGSKSLDAYLKEIA